MRAQAYRMKYALFFTQNSSQLRVQERSPTRENQPARLEKTLIIVPREGVRLDARVSFARNVI